MGIERIHEKISELLAVMVDEGYEDEIEIMLPVACHVEFFKDLHAKVRGSIGDAMSGSDPTAQIKLRMGPGNVLLQRPDISKGSSRRPILMGEAERVAPKKPIKSPTPKPNMDALLFEADMKRL